MKYLFLRRASVVILSTLGAKQAFATQTIYGLDQAQNFTAAKNGSYIVQAGAFKSAQNAKVLQNKIAAKTKSRVQIINQGNYNIVRVGPLMTASAVREVGLIAPNQSEEIVLTSHAPIKTESTHVKSVYKDKSVLPSIGSWFVTADLGMVIPHLDKKITVNNGSNYPAPENVDLFSTNKKNATILGFQAGRRWERTQQFIPAYALGVKYQHLFKSDVHGTITQYSIPRYKNYSYNWATSADVISLNSKVDVIKWGKIMPYINAGLGVSINRAARYKENAYAGVTPRISPDFNAGSHNKFYYSAGAGLDFLVYPQIILSAGYDYQSFGSLSSGRGESTWAAERLNLGNSGNSTLLIGLTYLIAE